jgi:hypothetical protein
MWSYIRNRVQRDGEADKEGWRRWKRTDKKGQRKQQEGGSTEKRGARNAGAGKFWVWPRTRIEDISPRGELSTRRYLENVRGSAKLGFRNMLCELADEVHLFPKL